MKLVTIVDFLAVLFDIGLLTVYFRIFFTQKDMSRLTSRLLYFAVVILYFFSSVFILEAYKKTFIYLIICFFISGLYRGPIIYKMIFTFLYAGIGIISESIVAFFLTIINQNIYRLMEGALGYIWGIVLSNLLILFVILGIKYVMQGKKIKEIRYILKSYWSILFLVLLVITICFSLGINYLTIKQGMENGLFFFLMLECLLIIFDIFIFMIFKEMERLQQDKMRTVLLMHQNRAQEEFYRESIEKNQQLKKIIHDEKNFLLGLIGILQSRSINDAIMEIKEKINLLVDNITDYTGIISIDTVLTAKAKEAEKSGILLRPAIALYGEIYIDYLDLVVILGNALDNAIEATVQVPDYISKTIHILMRLQDDFLLLEIRNPIKEKVIIQNNMISTTKVENKVEKSSHGFGLRNIEFLVHKYNGTMLLECNEKNFILKILLENECL